MIRLKAYVTAIVMASDGYDTDNDDERYCFHGEDSRIKYELQYWKPGEDSEDILIKEVIIEVEEVTAETITPQQVDALHNKITREQVMSEHTIKELRDRINTLLALPAPE